MASLIFTLYSRSYCHLCEDMHVALQTLLDSQRQKVDYQIDVIDVDQFPDLVQLYDELVPVLFARRASDGVIHSANRDVDQQLCHYFLNEQKVLEWCNE